MNSCFKKNKNEIVYLISNFLFNLGRVLPHAVLSIILLDKGLTISQTSIVQSMFMLAVLLFEFPSGILSDRLSPKFMYQASLVLIIISYLFVFFSTNLYFVCVAWFIYGLSAACMSGTLDSYFVKTYKKNNYDVKKFMVKNNHSLIYSSLAGGLIGSVLYSIIGINIYIIAVIFFVIAFFQILFGINIKNEFKENEKISTFLYSVILELKHNKQIQFVVLQMMVFQLVTQIYFQYWQFY